ncbi:MAG: hypothetical protein JWL98_1771 [Xanthomonadaceae bacterium]|nr:hypothetical protein [Xanthomonadaceae bacterium]
MTISTDRRTPADDPSRLLKRALNESQLATLNTLEQFGWQLKFVRSRSAAKKAILFDPDGRKYAVIDTDGALDTNPIFERFR